MNIPGNNFSSKGIKPGQTLSIKSISNILKKYGADGLKATLQTVMAAYGETTGDLRALIFTGTAIAVARHPTQTNLIAKILAEDDAVSWLERAINKGKFDVTNTATALADLLTLNCARAEDEG